MGDDHPVQPRSDRDKVPAEVVKGKEEKTSQKRRVEAHAFLDPAEINERSQMRRLIKQSGRNEDQNQKKDQRNKTTHNLRRRKAASVPDDSVNREQRGQ